MVRLVRLVALTWSLAVAEGGVGSRGAAAIRGAVAPWSPGALRTFGTAKSAFNLTNGVETTVFDYQVSSTASTATMTHLCDGNLP